MFPYKSIAEGSLEVKLPTTWRDGKAEVGTVREEKRREEKRREEERRKKKEERRKKKEERRSRCAKKYDSRETRCFSNDLWLRRVEK